MFTGNTTLITEEERAVIIAWGIFMQDKK